MKLQTTGKLMYRFTPVKDGHYIRPTFEIMIGTPGGEFYCKNDLFELEGLQKNTEDSHTYLAQSTFEKDTIFTAFAYTINRLKPSNTDAIKVLAQFKGKVGTRGIVETLNKIKAVRVVYSSSHMRWVPYKHKNHVDAYVEAIKAGLIAAT